jgi:hypothetical protein
MSNTSKKETKAFEDLSEKEQTTGRLILEALFKFRDAGHEEVSVADLKLALGVPEQIQDEDYDSYYSLTDKALKMRLQ